MLGIDIYFKMFTNNSYVGFPVDLTACVIYAWGPLGLARSTNGFRMESVFSTNFLSFSGRNELTIPSPRQCLTVEDSSVYLDEVHLKSVAGTVSDMLSTSSVSASSQTRTSEFYCLREDYPADEGVSTGSSNLLVQHGLEHPYQKFFGKKTKESLSTFLTHLPGLIDVPGTQNDSLQSLIHKPPIGGKELVPLSGHQLAGFRLNPGPVPDQFKFVNQQPSKKKHKHKKHKREHETKAEEKPKAHEGPADKKQKKSKKHEDGEKKKKKKDKKKKKRQSPEPNQPNGK